MNSTPPLDSTQAQPFRIPVRRLTMGLIGLGIVAAAILGWFLTSEYNAQQEHLKATMHSAPDEVVRIFRKWQTTLPESGVAVDWNGSDSEVLWVQTESSRDAEWLGALQYLGPIRGPFWIVWARTKSGRLFRLAFHLDKRFDLVLESYPAPATYSQLVDELVMAGRLDMLDKLKLQRKPA